ncbi:hypothetical protein HUU51_03575 [Candidatus Gracilibacteria bacterium]|nr:hypothetical protein [Candidatus Gracilibacteria bacterium]
MKKILFLIFLFSVLFLNFNISYSSCTPPDGDYDIKFELENCLYGAELVDAGIDAGATFNESIKKWINNISVFLGIGAVLGIVYGSFMLTISAGEDEKVNKSKDIIKWSIIGFIGLITASFLINLIIRLFYSLS